MATTSAPHAACYRSQAQRRDRQLDIPMDYTILCGLAVGYPDPDFAANDVRTPRNPIAQNVVFLED